MDGRMERDVRKHNLEADGLRLSMGRSRAWPSVNDGGWQKRNEFFNQRCSKKMNSRRTDRDGWTNGNRGCRRVTSETRLQTIELRIV